MSYILENARLQWLFSRLGVEDDPKSYQNPGALLTEMDKRSTVAIVPWRDFVVILASAKDVVIIGLLEDAFPYVLVSPKKVSNPKEALASGLTVRGEMSVDFLAAREIMTKFKVAGQPVVSKDDPLQLAAPNRKSSVLIPVERVSAAKNLGWFEVASLTSGNLRTRFPSTVVISSKAWINRDQRALRNFLRLVQAAMDPETLRSDRLVRRAVEIKLFENTDELRNVVQRRLIDGAVRPPIPDKQLISAALAKDAVWFPFLKQRQVDELVNTTLVR